MGNIVWYGYSNSDTCTLDVVGAGDSAGLSKLTSDQFKTLPAGLERDNGWEMPENLFPQSLAPWCS